MERGYYRRFVGRIKLKMRLSYELKNRIYLISSINWLIELFGFKNWIGFINLFYFYFIKFFLYVKVKI